MKTLHRIDFPGQMILLAVSLIFLFIHPGVSFIAFYIGIGVWQTIMALLIALSDRSYAVQGRKQYEWTLLGILFLSVITYLLSGQVEFLGWYYLYFMLFAGFVMAFWNMSIAYREFQLVKSEHEVWDLE